MKVKAVFINKPGEVETRWVDYPHKKENEVLIKVDAAGICGSDIGAFRGTNPLVTYPRIIGHEVTGIVLQEGAGMPDNIKEGDRVIVDPYIYCGHCYPCSVGRTNCCENLNVIGVHVDGAMQEVVHWSYGGIKRASLQGNAYSDRYCGRKATLCAKAWRSLCAERR